MIFDETSVDPLYRKSIRVSTGAALTLPHCRSGEGSDLVAMAQAGGYQPVALSPRAAMPVSDIDASRRIALVVGAEGPGLPDAILDRVTTASIPMAEGHDSLNVGVSAAVALYALGGAKVGRAG